MMITLGSIRTSVKVLLAVLVLACLFSTMMTGCGLEGKKSGKEPPPVPVQIEEVVQQDAPLFLEGIGNVAAYNTVDIRSRVTGELIKTFFKAGDALKKGQDLFVIDPAPFESKVKEIEAKLNQSKVLHEQATREYLRFKKLYEEKAISQEQLETKEVDMRSKHYQSELNEAELDSAKLNLGYCFIKSPYTSQSGEIYVDNHNIVNANQDKLVTVKQIQPIKVKFSVPGKYLDEIRAYNAKHTAVVEAHVLGMETPEIGSLSAIDNVINLKTGMVLLESVFPNPESRLWPGQFVRVKLQLDVSKGAILVPDRAVNDGPDGRYVWKVQENQTVAMTPVKLARKLGDLHVVTEGLNKGDRVITDGQLLLYPGAKVITREQMAAMPGGKSGGPPGAGHGDKKGESGAHGQ